ncbi:MAG: rhomboid family intramembrane serine protease, partial [Gaiellaceae bacterium]
MAAPAEPMYCYRHPDRETLVSCSECGRPICEDCMTFAPVGIRCPDHSGVAQGTQRVTQGVRRASFEGTGAVVTKTLVAINVGVYLLGLALGGEINGTGNEIYREGVLYGPVVATGDYWRLFTAMFLHYGPIHLGLNMLALWWFGAAVEQVLGRGRYLLLYIVSGLAGSAGALLFSPEALTVGASGAIF